jgi:hypothetical protein
MAFYTTYGPARPIKPCRIMVMRNKNLTFCELSSAIFRDVKLALNRTNPRAPRWASAYPIRTALDFTAFAGGTPNFALGHNALMRHTHVDVP